MKFPWIRLACAALVAFGVWFLGFSAGWSRPEAIMAAIVALAAVLWTTEPIPSFATALVVICAQIVLLTGTSAGGAAAPGLTLPALLTAVADPVMLLFFSGLVLARAAERERVDVIVGEFLLRPFAKSPRRLLIGVIGVTATFSMWMSNTATTAFMLTLVGPILAQLPPHARWRKALVLAPPFAASIGGMSTPIATPPNAIATGYLDRAGEPIGFVEWFLWGAPLALVLLAVLALVLLWMFPPPRTGAIELARPGPLSIRGRITVAAFAATVILWLTEPWHGIPAAVAGLLPVTVLLVAGVIGREDINRIDWDILILIAGGLALGWGIFATGLGQRIADHLPDAGGHPALLLGAVAAVTLGIGTFLSNTAVTNLILPVALAGAAAGQQAPLALTVAFTASLTMALPVSGPPNAMAYARGELKAHEMIIPGTILGVFGTALVVALMLWFY